MAEGDFSTPPAQGLPFQAPAPPAAATSKPQPEAEPEAPNEDSVEESAEEGITPETPDTDGLPEPTYTQAELDNFWDSILANKPYMEKQYFGKGERKIEVVFKTRGSDEVNEIHDALDAMNIRYRPKFNLKYSQYLLASGLHSYNGRILPSKEDLGEAMQDRLDFVKKLSETVVAALSSKLLDFERKVEAMQKEVFSEDF